MLINSTSRQLAVFIVTSELHDNILIIIFNYVYLETMWETDTTVVIYSPGAGCTKVLAVTLGVTADGLSKINVFLPIYWAMESARFRKLKKWYG